MMTSGISHKTQDMIMDHDYERYPTLVLYRGRDTLCSQWGTLMWAVSLASKISHTRLRVEIKPGAVIIRKA